MSLRITGHKITITPAIQSYVKKKIDRVLPHFENVVDTHIVLETDGKKTKAEVIINADHKKLIYKSIDKDLYAAIDEMIDKAERQVSKVKDRQKDKHAKVRAHNNRKEKSGNKIEDIHYEKPMDISEAIMQLEAEKAKFKIFEMLTDGQMKPSFLFKSEEGYYHVIQRKEGFFGQLFTTGSYVEFIFIFSNKIARDLKVEKYDPIELAGNEAHAAFKKSKERFLLFKKTGQNSLWVIYKQNKGGEKLIELDF